MKNFYILLPLLITGYASAAQDVFFTNILPPSALTAEQLLPAGLQQNYSATTYFKETAFNPTDKFFMKLNNKKSIEVVYEKWYSYSNGSIAYTGRINNEPGSNVVFSKYQNRWHGMVTDANLDKYILQQTAGDVFAISRVEELTYIKQDAKEDFIAPPPISSVNYDVCAASNPCTVSGVVIDIMVAYTPAAATAYGGVANTVSSITTAVTNMNVANSNSGVSSNISFNLVRTYQVTYTESGTTSTDLSRLRTNGDGYMDDIHTQRSTYFADLVTLIVASPTTTCGVGYLNTNPTNYSANNGFNVTVYNCVVGNYSMSHELGHNMGLQHDWYVSSSTLPCPHHHGYVNQAVIPSGTPTTARWRTILAYNDQCSANGFTCSRLNYWSNPTIINTGNPMGIGLAGPNPAYEVYGINRFACVVSAFLGGSILPLTLTDVKVIHDKGSLTVNWSTENELNVSHFEIEVAPLIPQHFSARRTIAAKNTSTAYYSETLTVHEASDFYVRLKYTDKDGSVKYSEVFYIKVAITGGPKLQSTVVKDNARLLLQNRHVTRYSMQVVTADGKTVLNNIITAMPGYTANNIETAHLPAGLYFIKLAHDTQVHLLKFYKAGN